MTKNNIYSTHTSQGGASQPICQMSDDHLMAMINLLYNRMRECIGIINGVGSMSNISDTERLLFAVSTNLPKKVKEDASNNLKNINEMVAPYAQEGCIRNSIRDKVVEVMQSFYGRTEAVPGGVSELTRGRPGLDSEVVVAVPSISYGEDEDEQELEHRRGRYY